MSPGLVEIGVWIATYFPEMKVISWALQARMKKKACRAKTAELKKYLNNDLESALAELQAGLARTRPEGWHDQWKMLAEIRNDRYAFANCELSAIDSSKHKTFRDKKKYLEKRVSAVEGISRYAPVAGQMLAELRQDISKINKEELGAVRNYIGTLREFYKRNKREDVVLEEELKTFEDRHPLSKIARHSETRRRTLTQTREKPGDGAKIDIYIGEVRTKLAQNAPEWSPLGYSLENPDKWQVKSDSARDVRYKQTEHFWHPLIVSCEYMSGAGLAKLNLTKNAMKARRFFKKYVVKTIVTETAPQELLTRVAGFEDPNMSVLLYETETQHLTYNQKPLATTAFTGYFSPGSQPDGVKNLLKRYEQNGQILEDTLRRELKLGNSEINRLIRNGRLFFDEPGKYLLNTQQQAYFSKSAT